MPTSTCVPPDSSHRVRSGTHTRAVQPTPAVSDTSARLPSSGSASSRSASVAGAKARKAARSSRRIATVRPVTMTGRSTGARLDAASARNASRADPAGRSAAASWSDAGGWAVRCSKSHSTTARRSSPSACASASSTCTAADALAADSAQIRSTGEVAVLPSLGYTLTVRGLRTDSSSRWSTNAGEADRCSRA